ncbi:MAG: serine hydrolase [Chloroflexota bacterium]
MPLTDQQIDKLNTHLASIVQTPGKPLASLVTVAFSKDDILYEGYFGHRYIDEKQPERSLTPNRHTKYRIASISKLVATIGLLQLVEAGTLDLNQDISHYLDLSVRNPHHPNTPITARMLLSHTSSIRDGGEQYSLPLPYTIRDFFDPEGAYFQDGVHWAPAPDPPATYFNYDNLNYGLIGTLIESVSGLRFDDYMVSQVLKPLGVEASYNVRLFSDDALQNIAVLYRKQTTDGQWNAEGSWYPQVDHYQGVRPDNVVRVENPDNETKPWHSHHPLDDYVMGSNGTLFSPQGGLRISAFDLAKIGQLMLNEGQFGTVQLLQPATIRDMLTPVWQFDPVSSNGDTYGGLMQSWGLGVQIITDTSRAGYGDRLIEQTPLKFVGHAGDAYGLLSGLWIDPEREMGLIYFIGGVSVEPYQYPGHYSSFSRWEEQIMTAIYKMVIQKAIMNA